MSEVYHGIIYKINEPHIRTPIHIAAADSYEEAEAIVLEGMPEDYALGWLRVRQSY